MTVNDANVPEPWEDTASRFLSSEDEAAFRAVRHRLVKRSYVLTDGPNAGQTVDYWVTEAEDALIDGITVTTSGEVEIKNDSGNPVPVSGTVSVTEPVSVDDNGGSLTVDDGGGSITVDGTVTATQGTNPWVIGDGGGSITVDGTVSVTEPVSVDDNGGSLTVDAVDLDIRNLSSATDSVTVAGTVSVTEPVSVDDNGGSLTVDDGGLSLTVDGTVALDSTTLAALEHIGVTADAAFPVTDNSGSLTVDDGGLTISIDDGGGSITVDGTVSVTEPVSVDDNGGSLTVDAVDLDIRNLVFATDKVDVTGSTVTVNEPVSVDDNGGSLTVDGAVTADTELTTKDYDSGAGTDTVAVVGILLPKSGGAVAGGTSTDPIRTDPTGTTAQPVTDNGGSLTVDGTVAVTQSTSPWVVGDGGSSISVDDNGGSITVDGTVTANAGTGTFTTQDTADKAEDAGHTSGDTGVFILGVRNDSAASRTSADSDYSPISTDSAGRVGIADLGGSITVDLTSVVDADNSSTTNLGSFGNFTGASWMDLLAYAGVEVFVNVNLNGTLSIQNSEDGVTVDRTSTFPVVGGTPFFIAATRLARYMRIMFDNGIGSATTTFRLQTIKLAQPLQPTLQRLGDAFSASSIVQNVRGAVEANDPAGGGYTDVTRTVTDGSSRTGLHVGILKHEVNTPIKKYDDVIGSAVSVDSSAATQFATDNYSNAEGIIIQSDPDNGNVVIYLSTSSGSATSGAAMHALGSGASVTIPINPGTAGLYARASTGSAKILRYMYVRRS